jgi:hypothetical protein
MQTQPDLKRAAVVITGCAIMLLSSISVVHGQEAAAEKNEEAVIATVAYTSESLRDPFEGYIVKESAPLSVTQLQAEDNFTPPPITISGITWGSSFPQAIVNNKVVKAGDFVGEAQVVIISKEGVVFSYKKQHFSVPAPGAGSVQKTDKKLP